MQNDEKFVIMRGNLAEGFNLIGPFDTFDDAADYDLKYFGGGNWVSSVYPPLKGKR